MSESKGKIRPRLRLTTISQLIKRKRSWKIMSWEVLCTFGDRHSPEFPCFFFFFFHWPITNEYFHGQTNPYTERLVPERKILVSGSHSIACGVCVCVCLLDDQSAFQVIRLSNSWVPLALITAFSATRGERESERATEEGICMWITCTECVFKALRLCVKASRLLTCV